jgi:CRP-like cAMP-binding protein
MNFDATAFLADPQLVQGLKGRSRSIDCSQERVLFCQGDPPVGIYIVHEGECAISMCDGEREKVFELRVGPGSLLGLPGAISNIAYSLSATALAGAEVSFVPREEFSDLMLTQPGVAVLILKVLAAEVRTARIAACKG